MPKQCKEHLPRSSTNHRRLIQGIRQEMSIRQESHRIFDHQVLAKGVMRLLPQAWTILDTSELQKMCDLQRFLGDFLKTAEESQGSSKVLVNSTKRSNKQPVP